MHAVCVNDGPNKVETKKITENIDVKNADFYKKHDKRCEKVAELMKRIMSKTIFCVWTKCNLTKCHLINDLMIETWKEIFFYFLVMNSTKNVNVPPIKSRGNN